MKIVTKKSRGIIRLVAVDGKKSKGYLTIWTEVDPNFDWIVALYVRPQYRNQSIARELIETAKNTTDKHLALRARPYKDHEGQPNDNLIEMYKSFGFIQHPEIHRDNLYFYKK